MELLLGNYRIQDIDLQSLTKEFGTPLYVYDAEKIVHQLRTLKTAFLRIRSQNKICGESPHEYLRT